MMLQVMALATELIGADRTTRPPPIEHGARRPDHAQAVGRRRRRADPGQAARRVPARHGRTTVALPGRPGPLPGRSPPRAHQAGRPVHQLGREQPPDLARRVRRHVPPGVEQRLLGRRDPRRHVRGRRRGRTRSTRSRSRGARPSPSPARIQLPPLGFPDVVPRHLFPEPDATAKPAEAEDGRRAAEGRREGRRGAAQVAPSEPPQPRRLPRRVGPGPSGARQRADLHDPRRPRRHRRLLPQPDVARPRAHHGARSDDPDQRHGRRTPCSRTGATTRSATTRVCPPSCAPGPSSCSRRERHRGPAKRPVRAPVPPVRPRPAQPARPPTAATRAVDPPIQVALHRRRPDASRRSRWTTAPAAATAHASGRPATCPSTPCVDQIPPLRCRPGARSSSSSPRCR